MKCDRCVQCNQCKRKCKECLVFRIEKWLAVTDGNWWRWALEILLSIILAVSIAFLIVYTQKAKAETTLVQKGYYEVWCNETKVSQHTAYHKALESAISQNSTCTIVSPTVAVESTPTQSETQPGEVASIDIEQYRVTVSWEAPTTRQNGTAMSLDEIAFYRLYIKREDQLPVDNIEIAAEPNTTEYVRTFLLAPGTWQIAATVIDTEKRESAMSITLTKTLPQPTSVK